MPPTSKLFLPPTSLSGCLMAGIFRDTRGADLSAADRLNHFPASPIVAITLVQHGTLHILPPETSWRTASESPSLPRSSVLAPQDVPVTSWSEGSVVALTVGVYPDAWRRLGGDDSYQAMLPIFDEALGNFDAESDAADGWDRFCTTLVSGWRKARPQGWEPVTRVADWSKALATRAALSGGGRSLRSIERRIMRFSGHTRRNLAFYSAFERLHECATNAAGRSLAEIAIEVGYSDQSHMGRAVRRATGFSPARLNRAIETEEPFWCYRLLGERF